MKFLILFSAAIFSAGIIFADPYNQAIQQAHRAVNQTEARSGDGSQPAPPPATPSQTPAADPQLAATLENISLLNGDLAALNNSTNAAPDPGLRVALLNDLSSAAQSKKATTNSVEQLAAHLMIAANGRKQMQPHQPQLARELHAIFNSSHLTVGQQQMIFADTKKILTNAGASTDDTQNVVSDLQKVASETK
jgi:hypothetical protein